MGTPAAFYRRLATLFSRYRLALASYVACCGEVWPLQSIRKVIVGAGLWQCMGDCGLP
jgi:hypothetical protein